MSSSVILTAQSTQSLLDYLAVPLPSLQSHPEQESYVPRTNRACPDDIQRIVDWPEFSYPAIRRRYDGLLGTTQICPEEIHPLAFRSLRNKAVLDFTVNTLIADRVRTALEAVFKQHPRELIRKRLVPITMGSGHLASPIKPYEADVAFYEPHDENDPDTYFLNPNRAPGGLKVSWKWKSTWRASQNEMERRFYLLHLSRVNLYMQLYGSKYGFILTDKEFVAIKRLDNMGNLAVSEPIHWIDGGNDRPSIILGLWYLGMLAAEKNWRLE
ncbi:hypothetical protein N7462_002952 [Penicillium macrosclerotiorum]|uniref:uncharacterized protein n=1 Tax=Penicillium macrosclerotiorum TaxID=303699 RepID=UPI0025490D8E|nr:uncharacterized protein N7462_002952 [Penicillium macrosclerotiorum]KAJ5688560.1 hypothetical protein N7462_002952 [Penicillium macrosclerotiorum]